MDTSGHMSAWGHQRGHLEVVEVIWDMSGHKDQLGVISELNWRSSGTYQVTEVSLESSELNWRSRRSSGTRQVTQVNLGS